MQTIPDAVLRSLRPRRAIPATIAAPARKPIEALRAKLTHGRFTYRAALARGVQSSYLPELAPLRAAAHALIDDLTRARLADASLETLAAFMCMAHRLDRDLPIAPALAEARGVADLVEAARLALDLSVDSPGNWTQEIYLRKDATKASWVGEAWRPIRSAVCAARDADYAAARDRARALGAGAAPWIAAHLAYAFPDEPWGDAALTAWLGEPPDDPRRDVEFLLSCCREPALVRRFGGSVAPFTLGLYAAEIAVSVPEADALALLGAAIPGALAKPGYGPVLKTPPRDLATALTCFASEAAARILAAYAGHPILNAIVAGYFQDHPELAEALATGPKGKALAKRVVAAAAGDDTAPAPEVALPAVLRERPWRQPPPKGRVLEGVALLPGLEEHVELPPAAHDHERDDDARPARLSLDTWNQGGGWLDTEAVAWVARHGLAALPGFLHKDRLGNLDYEGADDFLAAIVSFVSPRAAPLFARIAARRKAHRRAARAWLAAHAETAALGLIPAAVGALGPDRDDAEAALAFLATAGHAAVVTAAAARYGADAAGVIDALLERDPLRVRLAPPKLPAFLRLERLPRVRLASGEPLPAPAIAALVEMVSISSLDAPYPGLARLAALDLASLGAFAHGLLEQWLLADSPGRHAWMLHAVVYFPSPESERRLPALARDWARRDKAKAERACVALAALASDAAIMHLGHIAATSRFHDLRGVVNALLDEAAAARGLDRDALEDRTVPDLGLDGDGRLRVSFGARTFTASLDAGLALVVKDERGTTLRGLPRKTKDDDPALADAALARLKALKADAAATADRQLRRLEHAMVRGRRWSLPDFQQRVVAHPLLAALARALVWRAVDGDRAATYRVAEDGTFATVDDALLTLGPACRVSVAHPLELADDVRAWAGVFADYELIQPFAQLTRETYACPPTEVAAARSSRFAGLGVPTVTLLGVLEARGFERSSPGSVAAYRRTVATRGGVAVATIELSPGFEIADLADGARPQTLGELHLSAGATFGDVDPVAYSELIRDLEALRRA
ncbi:MAG: DUF4132 domain-containing protein [Myxococcales bacterium]|nr:DUF4132 domain-containing protein [Myxococcales bacterium]